ncbi:NADP-dependent malic enzyme [Sparganum proliferum]
MSTQSFKSLFAWTLRSRCQNSLNQMSSRMFSQNFQPAGNSQRTGVDILRDPLVNKGVSFSRMQRQNLKLTGLMPALVDSATPSEISYQERLGMERLHHLSSDLDKYDYLLRLYDTDRTHFFRMMNKNVELLTPLVYTPTVGAACQNYSLVHSHGRGLFIPITESSNIKSILENWPVKDIRAIVVTDGERILGLGDLGAYGMGIPVGKLALCTALAGIPPEHCLPIVLDVGTNNKKLLDDPLYFGLRQKRVTGDAYDNFVAEFMRSCTAVYGKHVLIQFEDFGNHNAFRFLKKYSPLYSSFNDDIQGTASVILSGLLTACRKTGRKLKEENIVCFGAGESMLGFAHLFVETLKSRSALTEEEAKSRIFMVDSRGLIVENRSTGGITPEKAPFARPAGTPEMTDLGEIIKYANCTALIGASAVPNSFTPEVMSQLAKQCEEPLIFALSNPTHKAECTAQAAYKATNGKCLFASGSPFPPVNLEASEAPRHASTYRKPGQANNSYIFPGLVLAISALRIQPVTDEDFISAAETLSENVSDEDLCLGSLYPPLNKIRCVSYAIARQVGHVAFKQDRCWLKRSEGGLKKEEIDGIIKAMSSYPDPIPDSQLQTP